MKPFALFSALAASALATSLSYTALAQDEVAEPLPPLEAEQPAFFAAPHADAVQGTICLAGDYAGLKEASAQASFGVVCDALRKAGAPVAAVHTAPGQASAAYRIDLQRLDRVIILRVTYEAPIGTPRDSRSLTLNGLDEVLVAADRVAQALVHGKPIEETATVDTLVGMETRKAQKKSGEAFWGVGLFGMAVPAFDVYSAGGMELPVWYETTYLGVGGSLRFSLTGGTHDDDRATFGALSFGVRGYFTDGDITPYVGGGLGFIWPDYETTAGDGHATSLHGETEGFGAYGEAGVELLRLHKIRFLVGARVDLPFFSTKLRGTSFATNPNGGSSTHSVEEKRYAIPITLNITFMPFRL